MDVIAMEFWEKYFLEFPDIVYIKVDINIALAKTQKAQLLQKYSYTNQDPKVCFYGYYLLDFGILFGGSDTSNCYLYYDRNKITQLEIKEFLSLEPIVIEEPSIYLMQKTGFGWNLRGFKTRKVSLELDVNYGNGFESIHNKIVKFCKSDDSGLILLHGNPGCGKTTYIRYLLYHLKNVIYVPAELIYAIGSPDLVNFICNYPNYTIVVEDAEELLRSREDSRNPGISALLNLGDGLMSDCFKFKFICTFNTDLENIDSAILRKGRLVVKHEFKPLPIKDSNILLEKLNKGYTTIAPMTLAEIYNIENEGYEEVKAEKRIGFGL